MILKKKDVKLNIRYLLALFAIYSFFLISTTSVKAESPNRYYAGYFGNNNPEGLRSYVLTIDGSPPYPEMLAEYINIYISYQPLYWVQLGYTQYWTWWYFPPFPYINYNFYLERMDADGHWTTVCFFKPIPEHLYIYELYYNLVGAPYVWHFKVFEGQSCFWLGDTYTNPADYIDLGAFVETSSTGVNIDGSHFSNLKYYDNPNWYFWSSIISWSTGPYYIQPVSYYEFYAYGGG